MFKYSVEIIINFLHTLGIFNLQQKIKGNKKHQNLVHMSSLFPVGNSHLCSED